MSKPTGMRLGFIEPHLLRFGGIRRMLEFSNRLVARGHDVTFYLPDDQVLSCTWMACDAAIKPLSAGFDDRLDVIMFNHEPHWFLLDEFRNASRRMFYALHYSKVYEKEGSWESIRAPVDLQLANSNWTADQIAAETGHRPTVLLGGANREVFRPYGGVKKYPLLCTGDERRTWKGTDTIIEAARIAKVPLEMYAPKDLSQAALGREYDAAQVFAVGSLYEGFCQPGLEAMACGVPLVTTDNGGCLEYAIHGETALVVPREDPEAMAAAIRRLLDDDVLAKDLASAGLELVERDFDWEKRTDEFAEILDGVRSGAALAPNPHRTAPPSDPELSVVVLAWDNLNYTQHFVESIRQHTGVPYELIIVDNGSQREAANYARSAADIAVMNDENLGFAKGMNQGLAVAKGEWVAFCNNDTILPEGWAVKLLETARAHPNAGIVVPALTAARNQATVRTEPGEDIEVLPPFSAPAPAVIYLLRADVVEQLGAWGEEYHIASGEDVDLAFKVWVNDLDIVYDQRVLVDHIGKGSASRLDDWEGLWERNRQLFLDKWKGTTEVPRLDSCDPERFARNRAIAASTAEWMQRYFTARDRSQKVQVIPSWVITKRKAKRIARRGVKKFKNEAPAPVVRSTRRIMAKLPESAQAEIRRRWRAMS